MKHPIKETTERRISASLRIALAVVLLLLNIAAVIFLTVLLQDSSAIVFGIMEAVAIAVAINIQSSTSSASYKLAWTLLVVALPAAYVLSRFRFRGVKLLNTLFMGGLFINVNYIVVPIFLMFVDADKALRGIGIDGLFLNNIVMLAVVYASTALPFTIYLLSGYFATLPKAYEEAAYIDGASYTRTMVKVIFPMAKPSIVTVILFNFLSFWNEYIIAMTLLTDPKGPKTLPVGLMNLMKAQNAAAQYGQMYAGLVLVMLPTLILYICVQKKLTQGMTLGGLKG